MTVPPSGYASISAYIGKHPQSNALAPSGGLLVIQKACAPIPGMPMLVGAGFRSIHIWPAPYVGGQVQVQVARMLFWLISSGCESIPSVQDLSSQGRRVFQVIQGFKSGTFPGRSGSSGAGPDGPE